MPSFEYVHRVRYRECDPMGVVYHGHYLDYFEYARTEALRSLGVAYADLERSGIIMPVIDLAVKYLRPARYDDELIIECSFEENIPLVRVKILYRVLRGDDREHLASGHVTLCFVDASRNQPVAAPESVRAAFKSAIAPSPEP